MGEMLSYRILAGLFCLAFVSFPGYAQQPAALPFDEVSRVIYDNDDHRDVYTDEYLIALAHLGELQLAGIITTYAPNQREYDLFVEGRQEIVEKARRSGFANLPEVWAGTSDRLIQPPSNRIEDTVPLDLPASRFIVEQARTATWDNPLVIVTGGQLTSVADAYLIDPAVAEKVIVSGVFGVRQKDYNAGLDGWAWKIVLSRFRVFAVPIGPSKNRGAVYMKPPWVPKERIKSELPQKLPFFRWMYEKHHPSNSLPDGHDYDGQAAIPLLRPDYITEVQRWTVKGLDGDGNLMLTEDEQGRIYEALDAEQEVATAEFWRVMRTASRTLE